MKQIGEKNAWMDIPTKIKYMLSGSPNIFDGPIRVKPIVEMKK